MRLNLRTILPSKVHLALWLVSGTLTLVRISASDYLKPEANPPVVGAQFLMAWETDALDTIDGYARMGDCWEITNPEKGRQLVIATTDNYNCGYQFYKASDPGTSKTSTIAGIRGLLANHHIRLPFEQRLLVQDFDLAAISKTTLLEPISGTIPNSRSVSFDATASGNATGTSLSINGTVANNADRYLDAIFNIPHFGTTTISSVTWNTTGSLTQRVTSDLSAFKTLYYWDMVAPAAAAANLVITLNESNDVHGGWQSTYGVDQTNPRQGSATNAGNSTAPSVTVASSTGNLVVSGVSFQSAGETLTEDATWTKDWGDEIGLWDPVCAGCHKAGAASVTRTDTLSSANIWAAIAVSLAAAGGAAATNPGWMNSRGGWW